MNWYEIQRYNDVNTKFEIFEKLFLYALNIVVPEKSHILCNPDNYSSIVSEFPYSDLNIICAINSQDTLLQKLKRQLN